MKSFTSQLHHQPKLRVMQFEPRSDHLPYSSDTHPFHAM